MKDQTLRRMMISSDTQPLALRVLLCNAFYGRGGLFLAFIITYGGGDRWGIIWIFQVASEQEFSSAA